MKLPRPTTRPSYVARGGIQPSPKAEAFFAHALRLYPANGKKWPSKVLHKSADLMLLRLHAQKLETPHLPLRRHQDKRREGTFIYLGFWPFRTSFVLCIPWGKP